MALKYGISNEHIREFSKNSRVASRVNNVISSSEQMIMCLQANLIAKIINSNQNGVTLRSLRKNPNYIFENQKHVIPLTSSASLQEVDEITTANSVSVFKPSLN